MWNDFWRWKIFDEIIPIADKAAFEMTKTLSKKGILVGISSGAVVHVALDYCKTLSDKDIVVVTFGDSGRAYLSKVFV